VHALFQHILPFACEEAKAPATRPASECSTTAGTWGKEIMLCPK